ncbi:RNA binding protein fox-1 homolog 2-like isoform X1 [Planococcus citri]|uniref:RNA binding protein fox-1 homolog 2-like isoform X1 n=1 Tax=Planococcus citri TaxID=170843 RepID=UPI0031F8C426
MSPTVPACAFASLSNGINNSAAAQMLMTSNGQVFPSLASGFAAADNVSNFKAAITNEQNCANNLMINTSPTLMKDELQAFQMTPLVSLAPTQTSSVLVNGTAKITSNDDSTNLVLKSDQNNDTTTTENTTVSSPETKKDEDSPSPDLQKTNESDKQASSSNNSVNGISSPSPSLPPWSSTTQTKSEDSDSSSNDNSRPKRLYISNIPFRYRDPDLRNMCSSFGPILDVEIIFNMRGSKGFGFVTFANSADADAAREKLHGSMVEGRKIEVNNATARIQSKKFNQQNQNGQVSTSPSIITPQIVTSVPTSSVSPNVCIQWPDAATALRGVAIQRAAVAASRAKMIAAAAVAAAGQAGPNHHLSAAAAASPAAVAASATSPPGAAAVAMAANNAAAAASASAAAAYARQSAAAAVFVSSPQSSFTTAPASYSTTGMYYDPFLAAADNSYKLQMAAATNPLLKMTQANGAINAVANNPQQVSFAAAAAAAAARAYNMAAVTGQNVLPSPAASYGLPAGYTAATSADPYLAAAAAAAVGPITYGGAIYRGGYNRFSPY